MQNDKGELVCIMEFPGREGNGEWRRCLGNWIVRQEMLQECFSWQELDALQERLGIMETWEDQESLDF